MWKRLFWEAKNFFSNYFMKLKMLIRKKDLENTLELQQCEQLQCLGFDKIPYNLIKMLRITKVIRQYIYFLNASTCWLEGLSDIQYECNDLYFVLYIMFLYVLRSGKVV